MHSPWPVVLNLAAARLRYISYDRGDRMVRQVLHEHAAALSAAGRANRKKQAGKTIQNRTQPELCAQSGVNIEHCSRCPYINHRSFARKSAGWAIARGFILSYMSYQFIYPSETSEICFRARAMRIGNVGLSLATMGEPRKDKNLATEIGKAPGQLGGLPLLEAQNQVDAHRSPPTRD